MRVLLVNPFYPLEENPSPPLGLAYLAAALEQSGIEVKILDLIVYPYSKKMLSLLLKDFQPDIAGATSVTMSFDNAIKVIKDIKELAPDVFTIMGGPHVTFNARETMELFPELDLIIRGEGEESFIELVDAVEKKRDFTGIDGLVYRASGKIIFNNEKKLIPDIDTLPTPARHLLPLGRYRALGMSISMTTSRGCPFNCIFCIGRKMVGARVRYRDPVKVVDELEYLNTLNFPQINIADDLFTARKKHCGAVCDEIKRRGLKLKWSSFARVDTISREVLIKMRDAGCQAVSFGVETGDPGILKTIKKGITLDQVVGAVKICKEAELLPHVSFILGLPGESPQSLENTVSFANKLEALGAVYGYHLLAPFPGTAVMDENDKYDLDILTRDWSQYHANCAIVQTSSVKAERLDEIANAWKNKFDDWLAGVEKEMEAGTANKDDASQIIRLNHTMASYDMMMNNLVEEYGTWPLNGEILSDKYAIDGLIKRIDGMTKHSSAQLESTVKFALKHGNLIYSQENNNIKWSWVDYLN